MKNSHVKEPRQLFVQLQMIERSKGMSMKEKHVIETAFSLQGVAHAVLFYLERTYPPAYPVPGPGKLARILGRTPQQIGDAMKQLWQADLLWKVKAPGSGTEYYLNPNQYWSGTATGRRLHIKELGPYRVLPPRFVNVKGGRVLVIDQDPDDGLPEVVGDGEDLTPEEIAEYENLQVMRA